VLALVLCRFVQTSAAVLLAGTAVLRLLAWGTGIERAAFWNRLAWSSWSVLLAASGLQLALTSAEMSGEPLARAMSSGTLGLVLGGTGFGGVWKARAWLLAGVLLVQCFITAVGRSEDRPGLRATLEVTGALLAAAVLATLVWAGHAHASDKHAWLLPVDVVHVLAAGCWPGGLLPLAILLGRTRTAPDLVKPAVSITRRFSRLSVAAVSGLALSGLLNAVGLVGTLSALWPSPYGRLILCKVALRAGMVGLGAVNRRLIRQEAPGDAAQTLRNLWRNVACECALAVCVLLATETLAMNAPPASA
jgi:putative copper resistance protein D